MGLLVTRVSPRVLLLVAGLALASSSAQADALARPGAIASGPPTGQLLAPPQSELHIAPVDAPVTDPFRAPEHEFGPGNRGIEYGTEAGDEAVASAGGIVSFAGSVAGSLFVTVDHGDGLVTTVGFLGDVSVSRGDVVNQGDLLGIARERTHFSARRDGVYFDPADLFGVVVVTVRLVAGPG